jgi:hypothetical protein
LPGRLPALADKLVSLMSSSREAEWWRTVSKEEMSGLRIMVVKIRGRFCYLVKEDVCFGCFQED